MYRSTLEITPVVNYRLWILPLWHRLCTLFLCSMTHNDITMDNGVARDAHFIMPYYGLFLRNILYPIYRSPLDITTVAYNILWILRLCTLLLCSMTHFDITMVMTLLEMPIVISQWAMTLLETSINCDVTIPTNDVVMCISQCIITLL